MNDLNNLPANACKRPTHQIEILNNAVYRDVVEKVRKRIEETVIPEVFDEDLDTTIHKAYALYLAGRHQEVMDMIEPIDLAAISKQQREEIIILKMKILIDSGEEEKMIDQVNTIVADPQERAYLLIGLFSHCKSIGNVNLAKRLKDYIISINESLMSDLEKVEMRLKKKALKKHKKPIKPDLFDHGIYFINQNKPEKAAECFDYLAEVYPNFGEDLESYQKILPDLRMLPADLELLKQDNPEPEEFLKVKARVMRLISRCPRNFDALTAGAIACIRTEDFTGYSKIRTKFRHEFWNFPDAHRILAEVSLVRARNIDLIKDPKGHIQLLESAQTRFMEYLAILEITKTETPDEQVYSKLVYIEKQLKKLRVKILLSKKEQARARLLKKQAREFIGKKLYAEARPLVEGLINMGAEDHQILAWKLEIAIAEKDAETGYNVFEKIKNRLPEKIIIRFQRQLRNLEALSDSLRSRKNPSMSNPIWDKLGSLTPIDRKTAIVTNYERWQKSDTIE